ncbi:MAG: M23 family metallopeptidase [Cyanobacteria bacterium J06621_11]
MMNRRQFLSVAALTTTGAFFPCCQRHNALAQQLSLDSDDIYWLTGRAWLHAIASAEGLARYGKAAYNLAYQYKRFEGYDDHPRTRAESPIPGTNQVSDASGPYQILSTTWDKCRRRHPDIWLADEPSFSPANQDRCALALSWDAGGHRHLLDGCAVVNGHLSVSYAAFKRAVFADSIEWASFPGHNIGASTGQHTKPRWSIWTSFQEALWEQCGYRRRIHPVLDALTVTSAMGPRWGRLHGGVDLAATIGEPVYAPERCQVTKVESEHRAGLHVVVQLLDFPELELSFCHLSAANCAKGDELDAGSVLGLAGATGTVTGPHLHVSAWCDGGLFDPYRYLMMSQWIA